MQGIKSSSLQNTFESLLRASSTLNQLKQIHCRLIYLDHHQDQFLITTLIKLLSQKFRDIRYCLSIFYQTHNPNTFLFNAMIQALSQTPGFEIKALSVYTLQLCSEPNDSYRRPNCFTFPSVLKACVSAFSSVKPIQEIHTQLIKLGTYSDVYVGSTLLDSYSKCNGIEFAQRVFEEMPERNVISWNSMISAFAKGGDVDSAKRLFEEMPGKNLVSWTSLISGYAQNGYFSETLATFENMGKAGVKPNEITLVSVISACANLGALGFGRRIHSFMEDNHYKFDLFVASSLVDMYCKCGVVQDALKLYKKMHLKNVVTCSSMIVGLAMNGREMQAIEIFEEMRSQGMIPNDITFIGVLCACCHAGLVEKGKFYFSSMTKEYSLVPKLQHYACIVDLLGRAGQLDQAHKFIKEMPIKPDAIVWGALLGACRIHKNNKLGIFAAQRILELDPKHSGGLVFLSKAYARVGDWDGLKKVRRMMKTSGMKKVPGKSWIEVGNVVHQFFAGDKSHHQNDKNICKLNESTKLLELQRYMPNVDSVSSDIEDEEKERSLNAHSEKLLQLPLV